MWGTRDFSTGEKGEGDFPSCYEGILAVPFKSVQVNQTLSQVEGNWVSFHLAARTEGSSLFL